MGCLAEAIFDILIEGVMELVVYVYVKLMGLIIPHQTFTKEIEEKLERIVKIVSAVLFFTLLAGFILMAIKEVPVLHSIGKILTFGSLTIICSQIITGIIVKITGRAKK